MARRHRGAADLRPCQNLATSYESEFRHLGRPTLVPHGRGDLNVPANDALRAAGNDDVQHAVLPWLDHYFKPATAAPAEREWAQVRHKGLRQPMISGAST